MRRVCLFLRMIHVAALAASLAFWSARPGNAQDFEPVTKRSDFVGLIDGRALTRFGIELTVRAGGTIDGSAFGKTVRGAWRWQDGYFCRDLSFGATALAPNCQAVLVKGDILRFVSDRGAGQSADLRLR